MTFEEELIFDALRKRYEMVVDYYERLGEFFGKKRKKNPPRLATTIPYKGDVGVIVVPKPVVYNPKSLLIPLSEYLTSNEDCPKYKPETNHIHLPYETLLIGDNEISLAHETTHSVIHPKKERIRINEPDLESFIAPLNRLKVIYSRNQQLYPDLPKAKFRVFTSEFFTPIGVTFLHGSHEQNDWPRYIQNLECMPEYTNDPRLQINRFDSIIEHLPQIAGVILVDQYHGDVKALIREHPHLPHLNGPKIWEQYCLPLLRDGRLI